MGIRSNFYIFLAASLSGRNDHKQSSTKKTKSLTFYPQLHKEVIDSQIYNTSYIKKTIVTV